MKRNWRRVAIAAALLGATCLAGVLLAYLATAPDFVAGALSRAMGRRVEIAAFELRFGTMVEVRARDVVIFPGEDPGAQPLFRAERIVGRQDWPRLISGQLIPVEWDLQAPQLWIDLSGAEGAGWDPGRRLTPLRLQISRGEIAIQLGTGEPLRIEALELRSIRGLLGSDLSGEASADLARGDRSIGHLEAEFSGHPDDLELRANLRGVDLGALPAGGLQDLRGMAEGTASLRYAAGRPLETSVDLALSELSVTLPGFGRPLTPAKAHLTARLKRRAGRLAIQLDRMDLDDLRISGGVQIGTGKGARVSGSLALADFAPGQPAGDRLHFVSLMGLRFASWRGLNQRIEGGIVEDFQLLFNVPRDGLGGSLSFNRKFSSSELRASAHLRDGVYRPNPGSAPLEAISGSIELRGNVLEFKQIEMSRGGRPLPRIDVRIDGMHRLAHLPADERGAPPGPGVPIPGLGPAFAALTSGGTEGTEAPALRLSEFDLGYPAFVLRFRDASARLRFPAGKLVVEEAEGVLGGAPARLAAIWDRVENTVSVDVTYLDGQAPPPRELPADLEASWAAGRFQLEQIYLGNWLVEDVQGRARAVGAEISLPEITGGLAGGVLTARGGVSLERTGEAPVEFQTDASGCDAAGIQGPLGMEAGTLSGSAAMEGHWAGILHPGRPFLADVDATLKVHLSDGAVGNLPATLLLARLPSLQGVRGLFGQPLPYTSITAELRIQDGKLKTEDFALSGPELRLLAAGEIDLLTQELETDMVLALLFLQTVDRVIGQVPLVRDLVLGEDGSLLALYFKLEGPWKAPQGRLLAPSAVGTAAGWAGKIIGAGAKQLWKLLPVGRASPEGEADETPSTN